MLTFYNIRNMEANDLIFFNDLQPVSDLVEIIYQFGNT